MNKMSEFVKQYENMVTSHVMTNIPSHLAPIGTVPTDVEFDVFFREFEEYKISDGFSSSTHTFAAEIYQLKKWTQQYLDKYSEIPPGDYIHGDNHSLRNMCQKLNNWIGLIEPEHRVGFWVPVNCMVILCYPTSDATPVYVLAEIRKLYGDPVLPKAEVRKLLLDKMLNTFTWKKLTKAEYDRVFAPSARKFLIPKSVVNGLV